MKKSLKLLIIIFVCLTLTLPGIAKKKKEEKSNGWMSSSTFSGLKFRSIGPAYTSGRIADFAINPNDPSEYFVGVACGHVWKTDNAGITFKPVFDNYGSYSIGVVTMDPTNPNVIWIGTGENNHQRALGYGDGVYKSVDGGKSWKNMGLKESRQIGEILVNPENPDIVYVAAEGSAWGPGGDRGLYKTIDGGKTWKKVLEISEHTGVNSMVMDPRDPDVIIASSEQRRRHVHTKIGGGPETAIYKTTDGGENWRKVTKGLPRAHMGGMGLAISPVNPDVIYAIIEAAEEQGGFFRSTDRGESWKKMSSHASSGQYYNEIYCDPKDVDKVYSVETVTHYTEDGGKTWKRLGLKGRHVDDHALWIDPKNTDHVIIGGDGGVYETYDMGENWKHKGNLPVTQFYRVNVDNSKPFYYVYGGTQDNNSMGGPSQNTKSTGVTKCEWFVTSGGDGFWTAVDPKNPNIVYAEWQYGNLVRYDRKSGERTYIKPQPRKDEKTYKWNWNSPMIISPHSHKRIYLAANKVFRSDDMGDSWEVISPDLTTKMDRNTWKVMGKYWSVDAVKKDVSTSLFGTIISMAESPVKEGLLYVGTDDGLIQVTEDGGENWRKIDEFPGVPKYTYVSDIFPSRYDENIVFATFDNRKRDDFKPYVLKSTDKGKTWKSISSDLPEDETVHTIAQDNVKKDILFAGTEFGIYFSLNGGENWIQLKSGIPTIAVRDMAIQEREDDLVLATFGRGFYILDNYTPLREAKKEIFDEEAHLFSIEDALLYIQDSGKYGQGNEYRAKNPPFGATFTYYLKKTYMTDEQKRKKKETKLFKEGKKIPILSWAEQREEEKEIPPYLIFTIYDENDNIIREIKQKPSKGIHRVNWNLTYPSPYPVEGKKEYNPFKKERGSLFVMPGTYKVGISKVIKGEITELIKPKEFTVKALNLATLEAKDREALVKYQKKVSELTRIYQGVSRSATEMKKKIVDIQQTIGAVPGATKTLMPKANKIYDAVDEILFQMNGFKAKASSEEIPPTHPPIRSRLSFLIYSGMGSSSAPGENQFKTYKIIKDELTPIISKLKELKAEIKTLEEQLDKIKAPWTPGRIPDAEEIPELE